MSLFLFLMTSNITFQFASVIFFFLRNTLPWSAVFPFASACAMYKSSADCFFDLGLPSPSCRLLGVPGLDISDSSVILHISTNIFSLGLANESRFSSCFTADKSAVSLTTALLSFLFSSALGLKRLREVSLVELEGLS